MKILKTSLLVFGIITLPVIIISSISINSFNKLNISLNTDQGIRTYITSKLKQNNFEDLKKAHCGPLTPEQEISDFNHFYDSFKEKIHDYDFSDIKEVKSSSNQIDFEGVKNKSRKIEEKRAKVGFGINNEKADPFQLKFYDRKCFTVDVDW